MEGAHLPCQAKLVLVFRVEGNGAEWGDCCLVSKAAVFSVSLRLCGGDRRVFLMPPSTRVVFQFPEEVAAYSKCKCRRVFLGSARGKERPYLSYVV